MRKADDMNEEDEEQYVDPNNRKPESQNNASLCCISRPASDKASFSKLSHIPNTSVYTFGCLMYSRYMGLCKYVQQLTLSYFIRMIYLRNIYITDLLQ